MALIFWQPGKKKNERHIQIVLMQFPNFCQFYSWCLFYSALVNVCWKNLSNFQNVDVSLKKIELKCKSIHFPSNTPPFVLRSLNDIRVHVTRVYEIEPSLASHFRHAFVVFVNWGEKMFWKIALSLKSLLAEWAGNRPLTFWTVRQQMLLDGMPGREELRTFRTLGFKIGIVVSTNVRFESSALVKSSRAFVTLVNAFWLL